MRVGKWHFFKLQYLLLNSVNLSTRLFNETKAEAPWKLGFLVDNLCYGNDGVRKLQVVMSGNSEKDE